MLRHAPVRWELSHLIEHIKNGPEEGRKIAGMTVYSPARPEGFFSIGSRMRLALAVFRGQADALFWPGDR